MKHMTEEAFVKMEATMYPWDHGEIMITHDELPVMLAALKKRLAGEPADKWVPRTTTITQLSDWNYQIVFPRPYHPILRDMFKETGDYITQTFGYDKYKLRELTDSCTVPKETVAEMLDIVLRMIDTQAYYTFARDEDVPNGITPNSEIPEHRACQQQFWDTILLYMDIWVSIPNP